MSVRDTLRDLVPPLVRRRARAVLRRGLRFEGDYPSWSDAVAASGGYDSGEIVRRVLDAELQVKRGEAADARDGVVFEKMQFSLPVMAALSRIGAGSAGALRVLDIGGAFGGLRRHYKAFVPGARVSWTVVEQPALERLGREHFADDELRFVSSVEEGFAAGTPDVALFSSVLQYLQDPYAVIQRVVQSGVAHAVIDRTPCSRLGRDVLAVQKVPAQIYAASYPCWILSRQRLLEAFGAPYRVLADFTDGTGEWHCGTTRFELAGFILDRVSA